MKKNGIKSQFYSILLNKNWQYDDFDNENFLKSYKIKLKTFIFDDRELEIYGT